MFTYRAFLHASSLFSRLELLLATKSVSSRSNTSASRPLSIMLDTVVLSMGTSAYPQKMGTVLPSSACNDMQRGIGWPKDQKSL